MLSTRQRDILMCLLQSSTECTVAQLAQQFCASARTIRYDLEEIASFLAKHSNAALIRKPRKGLRVQIESPDKKALLEELNTFNPAQALSPAERQNLIIATLLVAEGPIYIRDLEAATGYSESTLLKDLDQVEKWLNRRQLQFIRRQNFGLEVRGAEVALRQSMLDFLDTVLGPNDAARIMAGLDVEGPFRRYAQQLVYPGQVKICASLVRTIESNLSWRFADSALVILALRLALACKRSSSGYTISLAAGLQEQVEKRSEFPAIKAALSPLQLPLPELANTILGILSVPRLSEENAGNDKDDVRQLALEIAMVAEGMLGEELLGSDTRFINDLIQHLRPTLNRINLGIRVDNPLLDPVREKYPEYMETAAVATGIIRNRLGKEVPEEEIGYIALHIGAVVERRRQRAQGLPGAVLVCPGGLGTTNILSARLAQEFPGLRLLAVCSMFEVESVVHREKADFIVATVALETSSSPVVVVDPLLPPHHVEQIRRLMVGFGYHGAVTANLVPGAITEDLMAIIQEYTYVFDYPGLQEQIENMLVSAEYARQLQLPATSGRPLIQLLDPCSVAICPGAQDWRQAVLIAGDLLTKAGATDSSYTQRIIESILNQGPYMVITAGVALLHAPSGSDIYKPAVALAIFPEGVPFDHHRFDPVRLAFAFCTPDHNSHMLALKQLMQVVSDRELVGRLSQFDVVETVISALYTKLGSVDCERK